MGRRANNGELGFGSDSFLDIIANIVGILIILIVIAGVRVSQAPITVVRGSPDPAPEFDTVVRGSPDPAHVFDRQVSEEARAGDLTVGRVGRSGDRPTTEGDCPTTDGDRHTTEEALPKHPPAELVQLAADLTTEIASLETAASARQAELQQSKREEDELRRKLESAVRTLASSNDELQIAQARVAESQLTLEHSEAKLRALERHLQQTEHQQPPSKQIEHKLTPVSRVVEGQEIHFHVSANRVAYVPVEELIQRLSEQVERQKNWLAKFHRHQGTVGPLGGFTIHYIVERQSLSVVEELRYGQGMMRIGMSEWHLEPQADLPAETSEQALRPGSAFHRALQTADPEKTTLTFWVYPDSFEFYRQLQQFVHREGFTVAARPLPHGMPISGSPKGSRSVGQ